MDISSLNLPVQSGGYSLPVRVSVPVVAVQAGAANEYLPRERVIQGEVLELQRQDSRSTHDFLHGRTYNQAGDGGSSRQALNAYQASARVASAEEVNPASQVDYYI